jgi:hypothetical protein
MLGPLRAAGRAGGVYAERAGGCAAATLCATGGGTAGAGATGRAATGVAAMGVGETVGARAGGAVAGGGGGIAGILVFSGGFAVVTSAGAGFSGLAESAQTPTPPTSTAAAPIPTQSSFFEGLRKEAEDSASRAGGRPLDGGTVGVRVEDGSLAGRPCWGW